MVIFSEGWGAMALFIPGLFVTLVLVAGAMFLPQNGPHLWMYGLALLPSGVIVGLWGRYLHQAQEKAEAALLQHPPSNPTLLLAQMEMASVRHTLYWIRMEYWGVLELVSGAVLLLLSVIGVG